MNNEHVSKIRVILADDHPAVRAGIRGALERKAADMVVVGEASHGEEALRLIVELTPDVAVLDCRLPGLTGIEVAMQITERHLPTRVVALSAFAEDQYVYGMLQAGVQSYLLKEEPLEAVVAAVRAVAQGQQWYSQRIMAQITERALGGSVTHPCAAKLSARERAVLQRLAQGCSNEQIAQDLCLGEQTIKNYVTSLYTKLAVHSRAEAVAWAWQHGLIDAPA
ncbi:MAG TPA: response regulator transcription factor [Anaerolineae bacterium]|nr:response regulator transcription factor [Anaerolineae bacterium]HQH38273.1 response regulator transcription factor [Anaerolineae bacterium]